MMFSFFVWGAVICGAVLAVLCFFAGILGFLRGILGKLWKDFFHK